MRILLLSTLLVLGTPRIAAACDDDDDNDEAGEIEARAMAMAEQLGARLDALEARVAELGAGDFGPGGVMELSESIAERLDNLEDRVASPSEDEADDDGNDDAGDSDDDDNDDES